jgi:hypothetical protein
VTEIDFFISYTGKDKAWAEWIAWELEAASYKTIIQAWDFSRSSGSFACWTPGNRRMPVSVMEQTTDWKPDAGDPPAAMAGSRWSRPGRWGAGAGLSIWVRLQAVPGT